MIRSFRGEHRLGLMAGVCYALLLVGIFIVTLPGEATAIDEGLTESSTFEVSAMSVPAIFDQGRPAVAPGPDGEDVNLVVWADKRARNYNTASDIYAARVDDSGAVSESYSFPIVVDAGMQTKPMVALGGSVWLTAWIETNENDISIRGTWVDLEGQLMRAEPFTIATAESTILGADLIFDGTDFMVVWADRRDAYHICGARVNELTDLVDATPITMYASDTLLVDPCIGFDGDSYLVVWSEQRHIENSDNYQGDLEGGLFAPDGTIDGEIFEVMSGGDDYSLESPAICFSGTDYMLTWLRKSPGSGMAHIWAKFIGSDGTVAEEALTFTASTRVRQSPAVDFGDENFLVTWVRSPASIPGVFGARVTAAGEILESGNDVLTFNLGTSDGCDVTWNGSTFFVAQSSEDTFTGYDVVGVVMDSDSTVSAETDVVSLSGAKLVPAALGFSGSSYLALWEEQTLEGWRLKCAEVTTEGEILNPTGTSCLDAVLSDFSYADLAWGPGKYLIVWTEVDGNIQNVSGALYSASGERLSAEPFVISDTGTYETEPALAWNGNDWLVSWKYLDSSEVPGIMMARVVPAEDNTLSLLDDNPGDPGATPIHSLTGYGSPDVIFDGENHQVFWTTFDAVYTFTIDELDSRTVPESGDTPAVPAAWKQYAGEGYLTVADDLVDPMIPQVVHDGTTSLLLTNSDADIYGVRFRTDQVILDPGLIRMQKESGAYDCPAVTHDGFTWLVAWSEIKDNHWLLTGGRMASDGSLIDNGDYIFADETPVSGNPILIAGPQGEALLMYSSFKDGSDWGSQQACIKVWHQDPPALTVAVHQNPGVTAEVGVYVIGSEELMSGSVTIYANGAPLELTETDIDNHIYRGVYNGLDSRTVNIVAEGRDLAGNVTESRRIFTIEEVIATEGARLTGPGGAISLAVEPNAVAGNAYMMILPDLAATAPMVEMARESDRSWGFKLSGPVLLEPVTLRVKLPLAVSCPATESGGIISGEVKRPVLERETLSGWQRVESSWEESAWAVEAPITSLGHYRIRWAEELDSISMSSLQMRLGPDPWCETLGIRFKLPETADVVLAVYDLNGRLVHTLIDGEVIGGIEQTAIWDGTDRHNRFAGSGVYFTRLNAGGDTIVRRSILIR